MRNGFKLIIDTFSEVYSLLSPWSTEVFWDFSTHEVTPGSICVLGRQQLIQCQDRVRTMCHDPNYTMVFCNAAEGSNTLIEQCSRILKVDDLIHEKKLLLISGGDLPKDYPYITYEHLLCCILDYDSNLDQMTRTQEIFKKSQKPYHFLFLNGRGRPHRKYLLERFRQEGLLDQCLWTYLDGRESSASPFNINYNGKNIITSGTEIRSLPLQYEVERYRNNRINTDYQRQFAKSQIFNYEWGEIYLQAEPYIDSYFSVVTETVFERPWSFRTEKIAKVLAQGHPWICAASRGWYRDLRNLGFRTFDHILDESFDLIDDHQTRMERIVQLVRDLCQQDLPAFLAECESVCKYNQQHLVEFSAKYRQSFPNRFFQFIDKHA